MDTSSSSEGYVVDFVLGTEGRILRPPTAIEYAHIIEEVVMRIKPRLKYMGFRVLTTDDIDEYDRLVASQLEGDARMLRLKQIYVGPIQRDNGQSLFYMDELGRLLLIYGKREVDNTYEQSHAAYHVTPVEMRATYFRWMNRESLAEHFGHFGLEVGWRIVNHLKLELEGALTRMDQRRRALREDSQYVADVFGRLKQLAGASTPFR